MCLYDLQSPATRSWHLHTFFKSLEECMQMPTSSDLVCGQDDKIAAVFAKDVGESHRTPQG